MDMYGNKVLALGSNPYNVHATAEKYMRVNLSIVRVKRSLNRNMTTYLAHFHWEEVEETSSLLPQPVK